MKATLTKKQVWEREYYAAMNRLEAEAKAKKAEKEQAAATNGYTPIAVVHDPHEKPDPKKQRYINLGGN